MSLLPRVPAFVLFLLTVGALLVPAGAGAAQSRSNDKPYLITYAARSCDEYTDVTANLARNNIMESLEDLGADTLYNSGQSISTSLEDQGQPNCRPITGWRFTLGTGIAGQDVGAWGRLSKVASPYSTVIRTLASVPERNPSGNPIGNKTVAGAVTVELTADQAQRAQQASRLWVQGGVPGDPVLNGTFPNEYGFAALRCSIDNLNGDNVEWIGYQGGQRHAFCYAYYVKPPPTAGTIIVTKVADAYASGGNDATVAFPFGGTVSYEPGGTFSISTRPGSSASTTFTRAETVAGAEPWIVEERALDGWRLRDLTCTSAAGTSTIATAGARASITLAPRDTVRCTYTNTPVATTTLVVAKRTVGGTGSFPVTVTPRTTPAQDPITRTLTTRAEDRPVSFDTGFSAPGSYDISEQLPTSPRGTWRLVSATCDGEGVTVRRAAITVTLTGGQPAPRCELVNEFTPAGAIGIWGVAWGGTTTKAFRVERIGAAGEPFEAIQRAVLDVEGRPRRATGDDTTGLTLGTYLITELEPTSTIGDWELVDVTCTQGSRPILAVGGVIVHLTADHPRVACAFTNRLDPPVVPPVDPDPDPSPGPGPDPDPGTPSPPELVPENPGDGDGDHELGEGDPNDGAGPYPDGELPAGAVETGERAVATNPLAPWTVDPDLLQAAPATAVAGSRARRATAGVIRIPRLGVRTAPYPLRVTSDDRLRVPSRINDSGWWGGGAAPGARGTSVVIGHVDGPSGTGVFHGLRRLRQGDLITVDRGGRTIRFRVTAVTTVSKRELTPRRMFGRSMTANSGRRALRLVTCGGSFSAGTRSYDSNVIVDAVAL